MALTAHAGVTHAIPGEEAPANRNAMIDENEIHDVGAYVALQQVENARFWQRLGGKPDFTGQRVLDFGCGHGTLALEIAQAGAASVLGIDLADQRIAYAQARTAPRAPAGTTMRFERLDITTIPGEGLFDRIVSKDTFEHVGPVDAVLAAMVRLLKPGGEIILGFSPLYNSPFGDHGEYGVRLPWVHLLVGEQRVLAEFNKTNGSTYRGLPDAGFNMLKPADFRQAFGRTGTQIRELRTNPSSGEGLKSVMMAVFRNLARVPGLEPYFTVGVYAVLAKPA
jgi:ubiquinone/menaquinone biosynthesis C-methylase UbiE